MLRGFASPESTNIAWQVHESDGRVLEALSTDLSALREVVVVEEQQGPGTPATIGRMMPSEVEPDGRDGHQHGHHSLHTTSTTTSTSKLLLWTAHTRNRAHWLAPSPPERVNDFRNARKAAKYSSLPPLPRTKTRNHLRTSFPSESTNNLTPYSLRNRGPGSSSSSPASHLYQHGRSERKWHLNRQKFTTD